MGASGVLQGGHHPFHAHEARSLDGHRAHGGQIGQCGDHRVDGVAGRKLQQQEDADQDQQQGRDRGGQPPPREAQERDEPIHFRIETRRQKNIDRNIPISELTDLAKAKDSIHKSLAAVKFEGDEEFTISPYAVTRLDEDPNTSGNGIYPASNMSADELGKSSSGNSSGSSSYSGFEPAPYVTRLKSGELNPGSMAVAVPLNLLSFLSEWDREHEASEQVGEKKRAVVAKVLLAAANELQKEIYGGELETPDLGAGSHTRARALLFEVIRAYYPIDSSVVESKESLLEWKANLVSKSLAMWKWSMKEVESVLS